MFVSALSVGAAATGMRCVAVGLRLLVLRDGLCADLQEMQRARVRFAVFSFVLQPMQQNTFNKSIFMFLKGFIKRNLHLTVSF